MSNFKEEEIDYKAVSQQFQTENERLRKQLSQVKRVDVNWQTIKVKTEQLFQSKAFWSGYWFALIVRLILDSI